MITIATFSRPEQAHLFRTRLEAAGIPAFVHDEYMVQRYWLYSNVIGGVRVQIAPDDLEAAQEFLAADSPQPCPDAVDVLCPSCGSPLTAPDETARRTALFCLLFLHLPLFFNRRRWRCAICDHLFKVLPGVPQELSLRTTPIMDVD